MDPRCLQAGSSLQNGKYRILSVLGQGGFGITYLAEQTGLGMRVAIKEFFLKGSCTRENGASRVSVPVADNEELVTRCLKKFKAEARKIASLNNDHIVNIIDIFDENGTSYYVMKYLGGGSLSIRLKGGAVPLKAALKVIGDIADALKSVHSNGLLHLDVKPANILFDERGRSVLIDFGVSKYVDSQQDSSTTSSLIGYSRGFAPLEQVNSVTASLSPASDIYALGATLYNLVTGSVPPEASVVMDTGITNWPTDMDEDVKHAIIQAMQPRRKDRPQDIDAFLALLPVEQVEVLPEDDTVLVTPVDPEPAQAPTRSAKRWPLAAAAVMLAASIAFFLLSLSGRDAESAPQADPMALQELNEQVSTLKQENATLQKQVDTQTGQINSLNTRITTLQRDNSTLKNQVNSYKPDAERWRRYIQQNQ